jgi:elongation factor 1 alpha-like protein
MTRNVNVFIDSIRFPLNSLASFCVIVLCSDFDTPSKKVTLLDAPGHREFIPNMITGAAQADAAILVVPATKGEFEGGFSEDGQIREHAVLARSLGVAQLILAVNKLDTCGWSADRYNEIVRIMIPYLKSVGYKEKDIQPVPVSGLTGENILECKESALKEWYQGPVLLDLIDKFTPPPRQEDRPMRMCVQDVFRTLSLGTAVAGKVECGTILPRDKLLLLPLGETISVRAIEARGEGLNIARAGENVELGVRDVSDPAVLQVGQWLCDPLHPIPMVTHFRAQIITMGYRVPLLSGSQLTFYTQACSEPVVLRSLHSIIDKVSGGVIKRNPRVLPRESTAVVELTSRNKICLELFKNYRQLGRFSLRRGQETVAVGICIKLYRLT